jgi:hypothetical protein
MFKEESMFKENKYTKWYFQIIERSREFRSLDFVEKHHVVPRCLNGSNCKENIANLTPREHFLCHLLLVKMNSSHLLKFALIRMSTCNQFQKRKINSHWYDYLKRLNSEASHIRSKGKGGSHKGKKKFYHPETLAEKFFLAGEQPLGWIPGWNPKNRKQIGISNKGKIGYINAEGTRIFLPPEILPPEGFIRGGSKNNGSEKLKGLRWFHSSEEEGKFIEPPVGWIPGRLKIWITDGLKNLMISQSETIPEGWYRGKSGNPGPKVGIPGRRRIHKPLMTPFGKFDSHIDFCAKYGASTDIFKSFKRRFYHPNILQKLKELGLNTKLSKQELGFYFI